MPELDPLRVAKALAYLQNAHPPVFGATVHNFRLNPVLDESDVAAFERTHHVSLPKDFRAFLTSLGDGGAGPFYGVSPLGKIDHDFTLRVWQEGDVGGLSEPFPFEDEWNDLSARPAEDLFHRNESEYWKQMEAFENAYWSTDLVNGAFPICHQGCALRILLVVTGRQAGYLWDDRRSEYEGLKPLRLPDGSRATFSPWYDEWLRSCLNQAKAPQG